MPMPWNLLTVLGTLVIIVLALVGLVALVLLAMPAPRRQRAIPAGHEADKRSIPGPDLEAAKRRIVADRVTQIQVNRANVAAKEQDRDNRRQMAEGRA